MDATALTTHTPHPRPQQATRGCGLGFHTTGGPLVCVCGLVGGSGASTLALCLARQAARESRAPVLLSEAHAHRVGLAVLAGRATAHSLGELAHRLADGEAPLHTFTELEPGLRLIASPPRRAPGADGRQLRGVLREARAAHGLVIIDCGADAASAGPILATATHILWTLPARPVAIAGAHALLADDALPRRGRAREVLIAIALQPRATASVRALRRLAAARRCERLVLMPHSPTLANGQLADDERTRRGLGALAATLHRTP